MEEKGAEEEEDVMDTALLARPTEVADLTDWRPV